MAGMPWLDVYCPGCKTIRTIDIRTIDRHPARLSRQPGARAQVLVVPGICTNACGRWIAPGSAGRAADRKHLRMAKRSTTREAVDLTVRERVLLFCAAGKTDWEGVGIPDETVTAMVVKGLIERDAGGRLDLTDRGLTDRGRAALRSLLPDL